MWTSTCFRIWLITSYLMWSLRAAPCALSSLWNTAPRREAWNINGQCDVAADACVAHCPGAPPPVPLFDRTPLSLLSCVLVFMIVTLWVLFSVNCRYVNLYKIPFCLILTIYEWNLPVSSLLVLASFTFTCKAHPCFYVQFVHFHCCRVNPFLNILWFMHMLLFLAVRTRSFAPPCARAGRHACVFFEGAYSRAGHWTPTRACLSSTLKHNTGLAWQIVPIHVLLSVRRILIFGLHLISFLCELFL